MPAFVGRDDALTKVASALDNGPTLVFIEGEAGIGKSRLLLEVLAARPNDVLLAICPPLSEPVPLGPVVSGLRRFRDVIGGVRLSPLAGALRPLFPEWAGQLPPPLEPLGDPRERQHRVFRALTEVVRQLGAKVVAVEDAHWADTATLEWLLTLVASGAQADRPQIAVTLRPGDVPAGSLLLRLTSRPLTGIEKVRVELEPLTVDQSRRLVGSMLGTDQISDQFATFLHERTDGVPLALEESVRSMRERHDLIRRGGQWTRKVLAELRVPATVRDSVLERIDRFPPEARAVLSAAAILGEPADERLLADVAGLSEIEGRQGIARAQTAGLMREGGAASQIAFRHGLDAMAVLESIPSSERRYLHRRAAEALERVDPLPVAQLARHYREAGDVDQWCLYGEQAAEIAVESGHDRAAVVTLLDLLTKIDHPTWRRARLARKLAEAAFFSATALGDALESIVQILRDVLSEQTLPREVRGELRLLLGRMLWDCGEVRAAVGEIESAAPDLEDRRPDLAIRAMMNLALPHIRDWPSERHLDWLRRATALRSRIDSPSFQVVNRPCILLLLGDNSGWDALAEITAQTSGIGPRRGAAKGLLNAAEAALLWGRYKDVRQLLDLATDHLRATDFQRLQPNAQLVQAYLDWHTGNWSGLRDAAAEIGEDTETEPRFRQQFNQLVDVLDLISGPTAAIRSRICQTMDEQMRRGQAEPTAATSAAMLGRTYLAQSAVDRALRVTTPTLELIVRKSVWLWAVEIIPVHLSALVRAGRVADACALFDDYAVAVRGRHAPGPSASVLLCRAILSEADGEARIAATQYGQAADAWAGLPRPYEELLARESRSRCLLTTGHRDDSLVDLAEAERRLRDLGARWDADRIARLLRQHGVKVTRTWRRGPRGYGDKLSPRELEVVEFVARGMTNRQIADAMFISPKTVTRHLSTAMRKLSVTSRTAIAVTAAENGLLTPDGNY